uniref:Uncharacterized protein n=1 Tax=Anguilla anguilla TaxID=7936 RepID=A0A0E9QZX8_ANGAN
MKINTPASGHSVNSAREKDGNNHSFTVTQEHHELALPRLTVRYCSLILMRPKNHGFSCKNGC